jgi:crossover junction endodeoxyribonuclease RusA
MASRTPRPAPRVAGFALPGIPPGQNRLTRVGPTGWRQAAGWKRTWDQRAAAAIAAARAAGTWDGRPFPQAVVRVVYHFPDRRRRDPDNYTAALKLFLDAFVMAGVLLDDSFAHVTLVVEAGPPARPAWTEVIITAREEA